MPNLTDWNISGACFDWIAVGLEQNGMKDVFNSKV